MANPLRILILKQQRRASLRAVLKNHALLDIRDGGDGTFPDHNALRLVGDLTNTTVAYWAVWAMPDNWRDELLSEAGGLGLKVNVSTPNWGLSVYDYATWGLLPALSDDTLKNVAMELIPLPEPS